MLNIGYLAKTYGMLPSQILANATTYDLMVADVMSSWEQYQQNLAMGKPTVDYTQEQMLEMMRKVKS